jgi:signal peptidase I
MASHPMQEPAPNEPFPMDVPQPRRRSRTLDLVIEIATTVALAVVLYVVIQTFVVQTYRVEMNSMVPTLQPDQHLLIDKLTPRFNAYSRGDIVVFHPPGQSASDTPFIKRVIGVPGDRIEIRSGGVYVNGVRLDEPYVATDGTTQAAGKAVWVVPAGDLFVLGDHRAASQDSREFGFVSQDQVIGRAWLRFWPLNTAGILQTPTYSGVPTAAQ